MLGDVSFGRHPLWRHDLTTDAKWTITQLVCVMISVSKHISNVQYCLGTWVRNDSNPGSDMLPSHMKLIMIPVTLFNYPKWPFKFLFRVMRLEVNSKTAELRWYSFLVPFLGTKWYPKVQKFTKHHFLAAGTYIQKCTAEPWVDWAVVSNRHGKTIKWEAAHNSLQRDRPTPILMIKCDLYENGWLQLCVKSDGHVNRYSLTSTLIQISSIVRNLISVLFCTILGKVKPQFTRTRALC